LILSDFKRELDSLTPLFLAQSIAIIGASENPIKPSGQPLVALTRAGYSGHIYPVNPRHNTLLNLPCYPSINDIPGPVDLAIIAVPARFTIDALRQCADKGVQGVIVFTSGFAEIGPEGAAEQRKMTELARTTGLRICGPNCMGIFSSRNRLMANFAVDEMPERVLVPDLFGFISQSGGFGAAIYEIIKEKGYGFSHFVSTGNEADLEFSHYLGYMALDPHTKAIGGYLEGVKDGAKFLQAADLALDYSKPILLIKAGRSDVAARAAASHTGALVGSEKVYDAVFKQKGIIRIENLEEYNLMLPIIAQDKLPRGKRVAILGTSGGIGVMLADKCAHNGLEVAPLQARTRARLAAMLPDFASTANPVDITSAIMTSPHLLEKCAELVLADPGVDMVIAAYWTAHGESASIGLDQMVRVGKHTQKPLFNLIWGPEQAVRDALNLMNNELIPASQQVDFAIRAMASLAGYNEFRQSRADSTLMPPSVPVEAKIKTLDILRHLSPGARLTEYTAKKVLQAYGIPVTRETLAVNEEAAVKAADDIGYPVAMKIMSPDILHKTDTGGVMLNISTPESVRESYRQLVEAALQHKPDAKLDGVLVQEMLSGAKEMIVGIGNDPVFGSTVLTGLGGIFVEALEDVALRVVPVSSRDAGEMLSELKGRKILNGLRGQPPADTEAVQEIIQRVSRLAEDFPNITELDINPLFVYPRGKGACAADALIVLE